MGELLGFTLTFDTYFSVDANEQESRLNNQCNRHRTNSNLNNVLVNNNLNLNSGFGGTGNLLICNNTSNNLTMASSSTSPTSSTSTLKGSYLHDVY